MLFIDTDASVGFLKIGLFRISVQFKLILAWSEGMYFIVNVYIVKLLTTLKTLENDRIKRL